MAIDTQVKPHFTRKLFPHGWVWKACYRGSWIYGNHPRDVMQKIARYIEHGVI